MIFSSDRVDEIAAESGFSGAVAVESPAGERFTRAYGQAHRGYEIPTTVDTRFAVASGVKGFTALVIAGLIDRGALGLDTTARSVLGADLPLIDDAVTVAQLLSHTSGIGDYVDEEAGGALTDYVMTVPVHTLTTTEAYLPALDGHPQKFPPGQRFAYCNSGYVVLALIAERVTGRSFPELVRARVTDPAGMPDTAFLRSDELPGRTAVGYLPLPDRSRTNVLHLPVRGSGDGGIYSTVADLGAFWRALYAGVLVPPQWVETLTQARHDVPAEGKRYGMGFWRHATGEVVSLEGCDAGVSFRSAYHPGTGALFTVISNTSDGAWPLAGYLDEQLAAADVG